MWQQWVAIVLAGILIVIAGIVMSGPSALGAVRNRVVLVMLLLVDGRYRVVR